MHAPFVETADSGSPSTSLTITTSASSCSSPVTGVISPQSVVLIPTREMVPSGPWTSSTDSVASLAFSPASPSSASTSLPGLRGVVAGVSYETSSAWDGGRGDVARCLPFFACCEKARASSAAPTDVSIDEVPAVVYDSDPHSNSKSSPRSIASWKSSSSGESDGGETALAAPRPWLVPGRESAVADGLETSSMMTSGGEGALVK